MSSNSDDCSNNLFQVVVLPTRILTSDEQEVLGQILREKYGIRNTFDTARDNQSNQTGYRIKINTDTLIKL